MRALIPFAIVALWGCATGPDQFTIDMAACNAAYRAAVPTPLPTSAELAAKGPEYANAFFDRVTDARHRMDDCSQRAFLNQERDDAATAAGLGALHNAGESLRATGADMLNQPSPAPLSLPPLEPPPSPLPPDPYAVQNGDVRLFTPDGPVIGQTSRIGSPPPTVVVVPVPVP